MKKFILLAIVSICYISTSSAQDVGSFLEGGVEDGNRLLQDYMEPAFVGFGYALNSGWYNTGKPHKLLGFDLTLNGNLAYVPESATFFTINPDDYNNLTTESGQPVKTPTLFGPNLDADDLPYLVFNEGTEDEIRVTTPTGLGMEEKFSNFVPAPALQIGLGLVKNTELKLRLIPGSITSGQDATLSLFGLGVQHDVKQWIPGIKNLPFDLSAFLAFSKMKATSKLQPDDPTSDQEMILDVSGTTFQGIISKKITVLTVYGGLGFMTSKTNFALKGNYDTESGDLPTDPINLDYSDGGLRANVGARLKLLVFTFHAEYALQKYNTFTAGFGISVR